MAEDDSSIPSFTAEDLASTGLWRVSNDSWPDALDLERNRAFERAIAESARRDRRRRDAEARKRTREGLALIAQAQKRGIVLRSAVVEGFTLNLGQPAAEAAADASPNEVDKWLARHPEYARSPERH